MKKFSFKAIAKLKEIETLVEYYYNSGKFKYSLNFILKNFHIKPSDFYLKLAKFFNQNDYLEIDI